MFPAQKQALHTRGIKGISAENYGPIPKTDPREDLPVKTNGRTGAEILNGLCDPERMLVFVDESGTPGKPLPNLARDYVLMCGVGITSERYQAVKPQLRDTLDNLRVDEFHATEMVHPDAKSPWKKIRSKKRKRCLSLLADILEKNADSVFFCFVSGEDYYEKLQPEILATSGLELNHKEALLRVFFSSLLPHLQRERAKTAILIDSVRMLGSEAIALQRIRDPEGFYEESLIHVDSRVEIGIQLADFTAYTFNRVYHAHYRRDQGIANAFDELILNAYDRMKPKVVSLLDMRNSSL